MPDDIRVNEDEGVIEVISHDIVTRQDMERSKIRFQQIFDEKGIDKILIDANRVTSGPGTLDTFENMVTFSSVFKVAILIKESSVHTKELKFAENVGTNRSL